MTELDLTKEVLTKAKQLGFHSFFGIAEYATMHEYIDSYASAVSDKADGMVVYTAAYPVTNCLIVKLAKAYIKLEELGINTEEL